MKFRKYLFAAGLLVAGVLAAETVVSIRAQTTDNNAPSALPGYLAYNYYWAGGGWNRLTGTANGLNVTNTPTAAAATVATATMVTGGNAVSALSSNTARKGCRIINKSTEAVLVGVVNGTFTTATAQWLAAGTATSDGGVYDCSTASGIPMSNQVNFVGATTGDSVLVISY